MLPTTSKTVLYAARLRSLTPSASSSSSTFSKKVQNLRAFSSNKNIKSKNSAAFNISNHQPTSVAKTNNIVAVSGNRCHLVGYDRFDTNKTHRTFLDMTAGIGAVSTGHSHPRVIARVTDQINSIVHAQQNMLYSHQPMEELTEKLLEVMPRSNTKLLETSAFENSAETIDLLTNSSETIDLLEQLKQQVQVPNVSQMIHPYVTGLKNGSNMTIPSSPPSSPSKRQSAKAFSTGAAAVASSTSSSNMDPLVQSAMERSYYYGAETEYHPFPTEKSKSMIAEKYKSTGDLDSFFFANSGSEATDNAIKIARMVTGKTNIVSVNKGFHGRTMGALAVTSAKLSYRYGFEPLMPSAYVCYEDSIQAFEDMCERQVDFDNDTAAVIVELIQGEGGVVPLNVKFLEHLRRRCTETGTLLIFDEVQTGCARTGEMWATNHLPAHIRPDILTFAKGVASGFQLAGIAANQSNVFDNMKANSLGGTYGGNCVAVAAASATLDVIADEALVQNSSDMGRNVGSGILAILEGLEADGIPNPVTQIRQFGLFIGLDLDPQLAKVPDVVKFGVENDMLLLGAGKNTLRLLPPLVMSDSELCEFLEKFDKVVRSTVLTSAAV